MTEAVLANSAVADIEQVTQPTHDEIARQKFCSTLRRHAIQDFAEALEADYRTHIAPRMAEPAQTWQDIDRAMRKEASYRFYSALRYNAQEMCFQSVQPQVERALPELIATARDAAARSPAGGSVRTDPNFEVPKYVDVMDVHLTPGCFHTEWTADDVAQGAVVSLGARVFTAQQSHRAWGGVARVVSRWIKAEFPDFDPERMLDIGTSSGKNLIPYVQAFPGVEAHGIDVGAPLLRYGHAIAEHEGVPVHFSQQNAEATDFPDGHFDLIVSSFFFHEIPVWATKKVLAECHRLLRPGGLMVHQELPAHDLVDAWENYFWNWDTRNNNEPAYTAWRNQDPIALMEKAGFDPAASFAHILPDLGAYPDRATAFGWDEPGRPRHGKGGWYVFGSRKPA
ncbi:class I SAM-dependent methyltransferase [Sphingomonas sp. HITSZ_GF]|uniref:class I SAM-dependent methyltransferase n=1 Tax=Sphingomonas sp. HITSZ_GF TaxID=3037247 RepID=UPI00240DD6AB|nr:class I SAM-dependent methyltransferase [Sphingomonas sp. HITSZ_GF]MDG2532155.1 class I SAM-dependent methyltransferase [Sphingomonas sp. HITSZ_GF]